MKGRLTGVQTEIYDILLEIGPSKVGPVADVLIKRDRNRSSRAAIRRAAKDALHLMENKGFVRWTGDSSRDPAGRWVALDEPVEPRPKPKKNTVLTNDDFVPEPDWLAEQLAWMRAVQERKAEKEARRMLQ